MIETFADADALADAAQAAVLDALSKGLDARPRASLVATGGRSPGPLYDRLSQADLDWSRIDVTLSDERFVPEADAASNTGLVRRRLLTGRAARARFVPLIPAGATPSPGLESILHMNRDLTSMPVLTGQDLAWSVKKGGVWWLRSRRKRSRSRLAAIRTT